MVAHDRNIIVVVLPTEKKYGTENIEFTKGFILKLVSENIKVVVVMDPTECHYSKKATIVRQYVSDSSVIEAIHLKSEVMSTGMTRPLQLKTFQTEEEKKHMKEMKADYERNRNLRIQHSPRTSIEFLQKNRGMTTMLEKKIIYKKLRPTTPTFFDIFQTSTYSN